MTTRGKTSTSKHSRRMQNIKHNIQTAAKEVIGYKNKGKHKGWFDDECRQALDTRNKAQMEMVQKEIRVATQDYNEAHREAHKICTEMRESLVGGEREVLYRWVQCFQELLNKPNNNTSGSYMEYYGPQIYVEKPTFSMVNVIKRLEKKEPQGRTE
jgi:hypothetical protein